MFNYPLSLKEFTQPIPICQSTADLGNMLSIFQHLNCKMLAIPQNGSGWGIINSEDLLDLVAKSWLGERSVSSSHPRNIGYQQSLTSRTVPDIKASIRAAVVCQGDIELDEFLKYWLDNSASEDKRVYLVVNRQGELIGKLDKTKVIEHLASRLNAASSSSLLPQNLTNLAKSLEAISLPGKIITSSEKAIYVNQQWQISFGDLQNLSLQQVETPSNETSFGRMTQQWITKQSSKKSASSEARVANYYLDLQIALEKIASENVEPKSARLLGFHSNPRQNSAAGENALHHDDWHFLRTPITVSHNLDNESYFLVLAIPIQSHQSAVNESRSADDSDEILAIASHELKSPLTGVVGLSSLLAGQKLGRLNQRQIGYVELIYRSGKKMMKTIDDLLALTAMTAKQSELELIDLEFLCRHLYQKVWLKVFSEGEGAKSEAKYKYVQPNLSIQPGSEIAIADKALLSSALSHLLVESIATSRSPERLEIKIKSLSQLTAITIVSQDITAIDSKSFNLIMAKHIAAAFNGRVSSKISPDCCQFTLSLTKNTLHSLSIGKVTKPQTVASKTGPNFTILCLYPELEVTNSQLCPTDGSNFDLKSCADNYEMEADDGHRILEADSLEQAHNLARIWQLDAVVLNGYQIAEPSLYLQSFQKSRYLASLPLITLDTRTTEAANQIKGLNVYPCLLPTQNRRIQDLIQVIQIAIGS